MSDLPKHLTRGGPGDEYLGEGKVNTSTWFTTMPKLDRQIKDQEIWFCSAPFQMIYSNVVGELYPCSWATEDPYNAPNLNNTSMVDYFINDEKLNALRKEMITPGSDLKTAKSMCSNCMKQEKLYGRSRRQAALKNQTNDFDIWPGIRKAVSRFKKSGIGHIEDRIFEIQIKAFGNQCNLDCYMCMPYDSTQRITTLNHNALDNQTIYNDSSLLAGERSSSFKISFESLIDQIVEIAPYIYNLKLIGGEPLVMKQYYELLDAIVSSGHSKNMNVKYQTNLSVLTHGKYNFTDYIDKFGLFEVTASFDGIGVWNDYIRRRSNWDQIVSNVKELQQYENIRINVNGAISFLSVLRFYELIKWFDEHNQYFYQINWSNIRNPSKLCANVLPDKIKENLIPKYEGFPDIQNVLKESNYGLNYKDTISYLLMTDWRYKNTKWEMNLFDVFPELEEFYE